MKVVSGLKVMVYATIILGVVGTVAAQLRNHVITANPYGRQITSEQARVLQMATPAQIIEIYYRAVNDKEWNLAMATLSEDMVRRYGAKQILAGIQPITRVSNVEVRFDKTISPNRIRFMVKYYQESGDPALGEGEMTRFVDVVRRSERDQWRIDGFGSSP